MVSPRPTPPVGIVGLGSLGLPIARRLLVHGCRVIGYRRGSRDALVAAGGEAAESLGQLAAQCPIILTCLPSAAALSEVVSGAGGLAEAITPGSVIVDLGTLPIAAKRAQRERLLDAGSDMLDCTVSGNHRYVEDGSAALFASGERDSYDRCASVLRAITPHVAYVGDFGNGVTLKLVASLLVPVHTLAAAEALALASRAGLDPAVVVDAIRGTQASSGMLETRGARMATGAFDGPPLAEYHARNVAPVLDLARELGGDYPLLRAMDACYRAAIRGGYGELDQAGVFRYLIDDRRMSEG
jgi:3-hydroxyisobutyrate dehydrogenase